jgi:hypothetical protein
MLRTPVSVSPDSRHANSTDYIMGYMSDQVSKIGLFLGRIDHFTELLARFRVWSENLELCLVEFHGAGVEFRWPSEDVS